MPSPLPTENAPQTDTLHWRDLIPYTPQEFQNKPLIPISGQLPAQLAGTLYRNGPARLKRGDTQVGHLFDGDGAILGVQIAKGKAQASYRYVQTAGWLAEEKAGRFLNSNYGMWAPGPYWKRWTQPFKNAANTSVLPLPDKLLALWEGGAPHALNSDSLDTLGLDRLGALGAQQSFSAHPKRDAESGDIFNFGLGFGRDFQLHLYQMNARGEMQKQVAYSFKQLGLDYAISIHDFVLAGPYLVFFVAPVRLRLRPFLMRQTPLSQCMEWRPQLGTHILIFDRNLALQSQSQAEAWYQWHFGNGCVNAQGEIELDAVLYDDFSSHDVLGEGLLGHTATEIEQSIGQLFYLRLNPFNGKILEKRRLHDISAEFPVVAPHEVGQRWQDSYLLLQRKQGSLDALPDALGHYDYVQEKLLRFDFEQGIHPMEPIFMPDPERQGQRQGGWLSVVVLNAQTRRSELWLFDAQSLEAGPVCCLALPQLIPMGFHGAWQAA